MSHIDRIDLLVEDGEFPFWGGGFGVSDRHWPGAKLLLAPHEGDLSLAEVKHSATHERGSARPAQQVQQQGMEQQPPPTGQPTAPASMTAS